MKYSDDSLKRLFDRAKTLVKTRDVNVIKIFAPTGFWTGDKHKDDWLKAVADSKADKFIIYT